MNQFNGSDFPTDSELEKMADFIKYIIKNYVVVDPEDDLEDGFAERNKTLAEMKELLTKEFGLEPSAASDADLPDKLCNFLTEDFIEPIRVDRLFIESKEVRAEAFRLWKKILTPWKGDRADGMVKILENKVIEADCVQEEPWFQWYCTAMDCMLSDAFHKKMSSFTPEPEERDYPIYKLVRAFYEETQKEKREITAAYQFASKIEYQDFEWMMQFVRDMLNQVDRW